MEEYSLPVLFTQRLTCNSSNNGGCLDNFIGGYTLDSTAPLGATKDQIGNLAGALVRDNNGLYAYASTTPSISFAITGDQTALTNKIIFLTPGDPTMTGSKEVYWKSTGEPNNIAWESDSKPLPPGTAGFHLLIIDAGPWSGTPNVILDQTYPLDFNIVFGGANHPNLPADLTTNCQSRQCLFFLSTVGTITQAARQENWGTTSITVNDMIAMSPRQFGASVATTELSSSLDASPLPRRPREQVRAPNPTTMSWSRNTHQTTLIRPCLSET